MRGLDLFSGAGGLSLGAALSGIDVVDAIEKDPRPAETFALNHPSVRLHVQDVGALAPRAARALRSRLQSPSIVYGGPPCQGYSQANMRHRNAANSKNWLYRHFLSVVREVRPEWVVIENVPGIREVAQGAFLRRIESDLRSQGHTVAQCLLSAADFGAPQRRRRLFIVANRVGGRFRPPQPKPGGAVTVGEAIMDLPKLENGHSTSEMPYGPTAPSAYAKAMRGGRLTSRNHLVTRSNALVLERYRHIPPGGNHSDLPQRLLKNYRSRVRMHDHLYHRLPLDQPALTLCNPRKSMFIHPTQDRGLSVREAARLQSFPDAYEFVGSIGFQQQQVGDAVPPKMAQAVFSAIMRAESDRL